MATISLKSLLDLRCIMSTVYVNLFSESNSYKCCLPVPYIHFIWWSTPDLSRLMHIVRFPNNKNTLWQHIQMAVWNHVCAGSILISAGRLRCSAETANSSASVFNKFALVKFCSSTVHQTKSLKWGTLGPVIWMLPLMVWFRGVCIVTTISIIQCFFSENQWERQKSTVQGC